VEFPPFLKSTYPTKAPYAYEVNGVDDVAFPIPVVCIFVPPTQTSD
jgi:hypothetical protein